MGTLTEATDDSFDVGGDGGLVDEFLVNVLGVAKLQKDGLAQDGGGKIWTGFETLGSSKLFPSLHQVVLMRLTEIIVLFVRQQQGKPFLGPTSYGSFW